MELNITKLMMDFLYISEFSENKKLNTIRAMKKDLNQFNEYLQNVEKVYEISKITHILIRGFLLFLKNQKVSERSINRKLSTFRAFYRYLIRDDIVKSSPLENISFYNFNVEEPDILTLDEINTLRNVIELNNLNGLRDRLMLELLYSSGITSTEMLLVSESFFDLDKRELLVYNGKSNRRVFFSKRVREFYEDYIKKKRAHFKEKYNPNIVFVNSSGTRLSDRSLRRIIDRYAEKCEFKREISPYSFRHTFAVHMLLHGMNINFLKTLMGHVTIESTLVYENILYRKGLKNG